MKTVQVICGEIDVLAAFCARLPVALGEVWHLVEEGERLSVTEARLRAHYREGCFGYGRVVWHLERPEPDGEVVDLRLVVPAPMALGTALPHRRWDDPALEDLKHPVDGYLLCAPSLELTAGFIACCQRHLDLREVQRPVLELVGRDATVVEGVTGGLSFAHVPFEGDLQGLDTWLRHERKQVTPAGRTQRSHLLVAMIFLVVVVLGLLMTIFTSGPDPVAIATFELRQELVRDRIAGFARFTPLAKRVRDELTAGHQTLREPAWSYAADRLDRLLAKENVVDRRDLEEGVLALHVQSLCAPGEQQRATLLARQRAVFGKLRTVVTGCRSIAELQPVTRLVDELLVGVRGQGEGADTRQRSLALALELFYGEALRTELAGRLREIAANGELEASRSIHALLRALEAMRQRIIDADLHSTTLLPEVENALAFLRIFPLSGEGSTCQVEVTLRQIQIDGTPAAFTAAIDLEERWWLIMGVFLRQGADLVRQGDWHKGYDFTLSRAGDKARVLARLPDYQRARYTVVFPWRLDQEVGLRLMEDDAAGDDDLVNVGSRDSVLRISDWSIRGLDVLVFKALAEGIRVMPAGRPAAAGSRALTVILEFDLAIDGRRIENLPALLTGLTGPVP